MNRTVVVTGAASGIGAALSALLVSRGADPNLGTHGSTPQDILKGHMAGIKNASMETAPWFLFDLGH